MTEVLRVYQFQSQAVALKILVEKRLKISFIDNVNNPFEFKAVGSSDPRFSAQLQRSYDLSKQRGMMCFCDEWTCPTVWGHYADNHYGICIGFDVPNNESFLKVKYFPKPIEIKDYMNFDENDEIILNESTTIEILNKVWSTKSEDWTYENERRYMLNNREDLKFNADGNAYVDFNDDIVPKEIILGSRCAVPLNAIKDTFGAVFPEVDISKVKPSNTSFLMGKV